MALTLVEGSKLSNDALLQGVIETIVKDSPVLQLLPFVDIVGNSLGYNRENALPSVTFHAVGDDWAESTPTFTHKTATLAIMGGDADVDHYLQQTRSNINDIQQEVIALKAKAMRHKFEDTFINGDTSVDTNAFDGIDKLTIDDQKISMGTNGGTLTIAKLDEMVDRVRGGKPTCLLMSRRSRRKLKALMEALSIVEVGQDQFGNTVTLYNGIPVAVNDWVSDALTMGTSTDCSTVYAVQLGEDGVCGLHNGGIQVEVIGAVSNKNATRTRLRWYCAIALFSTVRLAKLVGVRD
ncbi:MAG: phage major capsid protein [Chloroflexi bacterium]|nr:phage major capsid protein [Chloroflexota bacterium]